MSLPKRRRTSSASSTEVLIDSGSIVSTEVGNTKRPPPSLHWCFTLNNYKEEDINYLLCSFGSDGSVLLPSVLKKDITCSYIFQEEVGEEGTPHLQGYVKFHRKVRPLSAVSFPGSERIHWEKCRSPKHAIEYCRKQESRVGKTYTNIEFPEKIVLIESKEMKPWQHSILTILEGPRDPRSIYWYYDYVGNTGKSRLAKYLVVKMKALVLGGKSSDMKYGVIKYMEKNNGIAPKIIIFDIPRCSHDYVSYQGIEEVKNGLFFSPKYESDMCVFNPPHVICFANDLPDTSKLSKDRWVISEIEPRR